MHTQPKITLIKYFCIYKWVCRSIWSRVSTVGTGYIYHVLFYVQHLSILFQLFGWYIPGLTAFILSGHRALYLKDNKHAYPCVYRARATRIFADSTVCVCMNAHMCTYACVCGVWDAVGGLISLQPYVLLYRTCVPKKNHAGVLSLLSKVNLNKTKKAVSLLNNSWLSLIAHLKKIHNFPQFSDTLIT